MPINIRKKKRRRVVKKMSNVKELLKHMPDKYESMAKSNGAMKRSREIKSASDLMLLCLTYLFKGLTLVEVSIYAAVENIGNISNVNFMKRFAKCREWFKYITQSLQYPETIGYNKPAAFNGFRIIAVDASDIVQRGALKLEFHLHYAYDIFKMCTVGYKFTTNKVGETLTNFNFFKKGDLIIADRAYGTITSIMHCLSFGADYIFRLKYNAFNLYDINGKQISLNQKLAEATESKKVDFIAYFKKGKKLIPTRICAVKKSTEAIEQTIKRTKRRESKNMTTYSYESKQMNNYIVIATSLTCDINPIDILELYRYRWQIELLFKRMKSLIQLGNLPNKKEENIFAWLDGKILCAMLVELIQAKVDFSPKEQFEH